MQVREHSVEKKNYEKHFTHVFLILIRQFKFDQRQKLVENQKIHISPISRTRRTTSPAT